MKCRIVKSSIKHWSKNTGWETLKVNYIKKELPNYPKLIGKHLGNGCTRITRKVGRA